MSTKLNTTAAEIAQSGLLDVDGEDNGSYGWTGGTAEEYADFWLSGYTGQLVDQAAVKMKLSATQRQALWDEIHEILSVAYDPAVHDPAAEDEEEAAWAVDVAASADEEGALEETSVTFALAEAVRVLETTGLGKVEVSNQAAWLTLPTGKCVGLDLVTDGADEFYHYCVVTPDGNELKNWIQTRSDCPYFVCDTLVAAIKEPELIAA